LGRPFFHLAAIAAAAVVIVGAATIGSAVVAAAADKQQNQDDDPPAVIATETRVAHKKYLQEFFRAVCRSFHGIPHPKKGDSRKFRMSS
jgi:hypothetical protein